MPIELPLPNSCNGLAMSSPCAPTSPDSKRPVLTYCAWNGPSGKALVTANLKRDADEFIVEVYSECAVCRNHARKRLKPKEGWRLPD